MAEPVIHWLDRVAQPFSETQVMQVDVGAVRKAKAEFDDLLTAASALVEGLGEHLDRSYLGKGSESWANLKDMVEKYKEAPADGGNAQ